MMRNWITTGCGYLARLTLVVALSAIGGRFASAEATRLSPLDLLAVSVAKWNPSTEELTPIEWLSGEAAVGGEGMLELPVVGSLPAADRTREELSTDIRERMQKVLGITANLQISVRLVKHAPIFVTGAVTEAGEFEYRPGLIAMQAIALAGGPLRERTLFSRSERDAARALGDHRLLTVERWRALAKLARLEAELAEADTITPPDALDGVELADQLLEVEGEILRARRDDHQSALAAIEELKALLRLRIEKLNEEMSLRDRLLEATREERDNVEALVGRGLSRQSRVNEVSRTLADLEARVLELETTMLTAEQQLSEAERDRLDLIGDRRVTVITDLQATRTELNALDVRLETAGALFAEAARFGSTLDALEREKASAAPVIVITRRGPNGFATIEADPRTPVKPGDVIELQAPDIGGLSSPEGTGAAGPSFGATPAALIVGGGD